MEVYVIKSVACLGLLYLFYKLLLENTALHTIKRAYLLASLVLSLCIPFITFTTYIEAATTIPVVLSETPAVFLEEEAPILIAEPSAYLPAILWTIYGLGVFVFSFRFARNLYSILQKVRNNPTLQQQSIVYVLLHLSVTPHSFFNYIFFSKKAYDQGEIPEEVIIHERAHVEQKHSWDILCIELFKIVFWFNPLIYFIKNSIKLNHEFLADRTVLNEGAELSKYQTILLDFSSTSSVPSMAHAINYSSTRLNGLFSKNTFGQVKKRFTVMKTHTSKRAAWLKGLLILPLLAVLIYGFSTTQVLEKVSTNSIVSEELRIHINETGGILVNEKMANLETLSSVLNRHNTSLSFSEKKRSVIAHIYANGSLPMNTIFEVKNKLRAYGVIKIINHAESKAGSKDTEFVANEISKTNDIEKVVLQLTLIDNTIKYNGSVYTFNTFKEVLNPLSYSKASVSISSGLTEPFVKDVLQFLFDIDLGNNINLTIGNAGRSTKVNINRVMESIAKKTKDQNQWGKEYAKAFNNGAKRNNKKSLVITINASEVMINGKPTSLKSFAKDVDKATKDWEETDYTEAIPSILIASTPDSFLKKLDAEFRKTHFSKANGGMSLIPPPPPPAPNASKATGAPNAPPAPIKYIPTNGNVQKVPPPPPPPMSPLDHIIDMAKKNATFYLEGKKVSSDEAIEAIKKNNSLNIQTIGHSSKNPVVKISKKPITFKKKAPKIGTLETGNTTKNGEEAFYTKVNDKTTYFFNTGAIKNDKGLLISENEAPTFYLDGKTISPLKAEKILKTNRKYAVSATSQENGKDKIFLTNLMNSNNAYNVNKNINTNPNSVIDLTEVIAQGAIFYLNDKEISTEKAKFLAEQTNKIARVNVKKQNKNAQPLVYFWTE